MTVDPGAGKAAPSSVLVNVPRLMAAYYTRRPDPSIGGQRVVFGTSGHRGSALDGTFNENHILAITQAICEYRRKQAISGPLFLGMDTHALSQAAWETAIEVLAANGVRVMIDDRDGYTPTPVVSHAIVTHNVAPTGGLADGIVITPSHNPPRDGGFKYNPPAGGPANTLVTRWIENRANALLEGNLRLLKRIPFARACRTGCVRHDFMGAYINDLDNVVDMVAVRGAGLALGVDPMGGAGVEYWGAIGERYHLQLTVVDAEVDPTFRFMSLDWDGKIRMDCSSPYAMARLIALRDRFDVAWACDTDHDRHGIVTPGAGLLNPNRFLAAAIAYLFGHRPRWPTASGVGKTVVSTSMIDRAAARFQRPLLEVPVGFKWFVEGLASGAVAFAGEESAGASFLRRDGRVWTTDKDGIVLGLLAAEMTAVTGRDPGALYDELTQEFGEFAYERIDAPATPEEKAILEALSPVQSAAVNLAGDRITGWLTTAPGNGAPIGGLKVISEHGWFAARPSGTEEIYKLYAESFNGTEHLRRIQEEAQGIIRDAFRAGAGS